MATEVNTTSEENTHNRRARRTAKTTSERNNNGKPEDRRNGSKPEPEKVSVLSPLDTVGTGPTAAETVDWTKAEADASAVPADTLKSLKDRFTKSRGKLLEGTSLNARNNESLADGLSEVYELGQELFTKPPVFRHSHWQLSMKVPNQIEEPLLTTKAADLARLPDWPALMRPDTLRAYLDCRSDSDFSRKLKALENRGYPGMDPVLKRHVKIVVDRCLFGEEVESKSRRAEMLRAARGKAA